MLVKTPLCIYPSIFNRFPVIQTRIFKIRHFSTFSDNRGKCHTVGKRIQCNTFTPIHLQRLSEGRTQGRPKCAKNVLKWRIFKLPAWITGKRLEIYGYIYRVYTPSIVTMAVSAAILEIFNVKEWPDLEIWVWGPSSWLKKAQFDRPCMTFY